MMSVKYQIVLPDSLAAELKRVAERLRVPRSQIIREAVEERLRSYRGRKDDPFAGMTGIMETGDKDVSTRVDEILYE